MWVENRKKLLNELQLCRGKEVKHTDYLHTVLNEYGGDLSDWLRLFASDCYKLREIDKEFHNTYFLNFEVSWLPSISLGDYKNFGGRILFTMNRAMNVEQWNKMSHLDIFDITISGIKHHGYNWHNLKVESQNKFPLYTQLQEKYIMANPIDKYGYSFIYDLNDADELTALNTVMKPYVVYMRYKSLSPVKLYKEDLFILMVRRLPYDSYSVLASGDASALVHYGQSRKVKIYMNLFAFFILFGNGKIDSVTLPYDYKKYANSFSKVLYNPNVDYYSLVEPELIKYYSMYTGAI